MRICGQPLRIALALPRPAPPHDDRRQPAQLRCSAGERGVAGRQILEVTEVGAAHAVRPSVLHHENRTGTELASARGACPWLDRGDHHQIRWPVPLLNQAFTLGLRQFRRDPVRPVRLLDTRIGTSAEPELAAVARARQIVFSRTASSRSPGPSGGTRSSPLTPCQDCPGSPLRGRRRAPVSTGQGGRAPTSQGRAVRRSGGRTDARPAPARRRGVPVPGCPGAPPLRRTPESLVRGAQLGDERVTAEDRARRRKLPQQQVPVDV